MNECRLFMGSSLSVIDLQVKSITVSAGSCQTVAGSWLLSHNSALNRVKGLLTSLRRDVWPAACEKQLRIQY